MTLPIDPATLDIAGRVLLVSMFPFSAIDKLLHREEALAQARSSFLPGAPFLLVLGGALELAAPVCIVGGWWAREAALLLAAFCVATAVLFHPFWHAGDFWAARDSVARNHFWDFMKNLGLAGGLLLVAAGARFASTAA